MCCGRVCLIVHPNADYWLSHPSQIIMKPRIQRNFELLSDKKKSIWKWNSKRPQITGGDQLYHLYVNYLNKFTVSSGCMSGSEVHKIYMTSQNRCNIFFRKLFKRSLLTNFSCDDSFEDCKIIPYDGDYCYYCSIEVTVFFLLLSCCACASRVSAKLLVSVWLSFREVSRGALRNGRNKKEANGRLNTTKCGCEIIQPPPHA